MNISVTVGNDMKYKIGYPKTLMNKFLYRFINIGVYYVSALGDCALINMKEVENE